MTKKTVRKSVQIVQMNRELNNILNSIETDGIESELIAKAIRQHIHIELLWQRVMCVFVISLVVCMAYYVPIVNEHLTAIYRLLAIKLLTMFKFANWDYKGCLVGPLSTETRAQTAAEGIDSVNSSPQRTGWHRDDCIFCEENCKYISSL